jgi:hypothetical protein
MAFWWRIGKINGFLVPPRPHLLGALGAGQGPRMGEGGTAGVPWGDGGRGKPLAHRRAPAQPGVPLRHCTHGAYGTTR